MKTLYLHHYAILIISLIALIVSAEFLLMQEDVYTVKVETILEPAHGPDTYNLSDGQYTGCMNADAGERALIQYNRGFLTGHLYSIEPYGHFKCD